MANRERDRYLANNNEFRCDGCEDVFNNDTGKTITPGGDELCSKCAAEQQPGYDPEPSADQIRDDKIRKMAKEIWQRDGAIEIDDGAIISEGDDNGTYVAAWVWVDFEGTEFDKEKADEDNQTTS